MAPTPHKDQNRRAIAFVHAKKAANASISSVEVESLSKKTPTATAADTAAKKKSDAKSASSAAVNTEAGLFPAALVPKYLRWQAVHRVGPGFFNEGNTCFLNSTLQCLLYLPALSQCLLCESALALRGVKSGASERAVLEMYAGLVRDVWQGQSARAISPKSMVACIRRVGKQFKPFRQEDAHEYLRQLLDCMHEELLKRNGLKTSDGKKAETSVISRVFGGYLCNTLACTRCEYKSRTYNHFQDLSLDLRGNIRSVQDALAAFTKTESLTQGNEWKCDGCKHKVKATKQLAVAEAPNVLVLHLKRFSFGNMFAKVSKHVEFPERLPLRTSGAESNYELTGVIVHHGHSTHSGHYIAYVKAPNGQWHEMNDSTVSVVSVKKVLSAQAYVLFYSRIPSAAEAASTAASAPATKKETVSESKTAVKKDVEATASISLSKPAVQEKEKETNKDIKEKKKTSDQESSQQDDAPSTAENAQKKDDESDSEAGNDNEEEDKSDFDNDFGGFRRMRNRLPLRFTGVVRKFKQWRPKRLLTDLKILARIMKLRKMNSGEKEKESNDTNHTNEAVEESKVEKEEKIEVKEQKEEKVKDESPPKPSAEKKKESDATPSASAVAPKTDVLSALLEQSRRGRTLGGEGVWENTTAKDKEAIERIAVQQRRREQEERKRKRQSEWDTLLDQGKVKKVKVKVEEEEVVDKISPFQRVLDERQEQQKRGREVDFREEPTFKHQRNKDKQKNVRDLSNKNKFAKKRHSL